MQSGRELQSALKDKVPTKIDIGPVYSQDPAKRAAYKGDTSAGGFKPLERELVFDIDLTDYDDVRTSASGTGMSRKCWTLMHAAIQVRDLVRDARVPRSVRDARVPEHQAPARGGCRSWMRACARIWALSTSCGCTRGGVACTAGCATSARAR